MNQEELAANASGAKIKNGTKVLDRLKEDHDGTVIEVLQSHLEVALKKNKIKECRDYIQELYGGMISAVKKMDSDKLNGDHFLLLSGFLLIFKQNFM